MGYLKHIWWVFVLAVYVYSADLSDEVNSDNTEVPLTPSNYSFSFETENGQVRDENLNIKSDSNSGSQKPEADVNVKGSYSFISADGYEYSVYYKAGKNGYQPYVTAHKINTDTN